MLRLLRPHVAHRFSFLAFTTAFLLLGLASSAPATIDAQLNTTGFTPGQASELCVDGLIYSGGTSTSLNGALLTLRFDPARLTLSGVRVATGWTLQGSNLDHASEGWAKIVLTNSSGTNGAGQTLNGPIVYFTVTPANVQVDVDDCQTLRLDGTDSNLSDQDYETTIPSDPCAGRNYPICSNAGTGGFTDDSAGTRGADSIGLIDFRPTIRILKIIAGMVPGTATGNPNDLRFTDPNDPELTGPDDPRLLNGYFTRYPALTAQDQATNELSDTRFWLQPCPPGGCQTNRTDPTYRTFTLADAIRAAQIAIYASNEAVWGMSFSGNVLETGGNAANATGAPAIADIDTDGILDAFFPMGTINGRNYPDPWWQDLGGTKSSNPNRLYAISYNQTLGDYTHKPGWPQPLRDAPSGVTLVNLNQDASLEVVAPNFQDTYRKDTGRMYPELYSRPYVWSAAGQGSSVFANPSFPDRGTDNPAGTIDPVAPRGAVIGHSNAAPPVWDVDGDGVQEILYAGVGYREDGNFTPHFSSIQAVKASDGTRAFETQYTNPSAPWHVNALFGAANEPYQTAFETGPIVVPSVPSTPNSPRFVAAASFLGRVFAWRTDPGFFGARLGNFPVNTETPPGSDNPAFILNPLVAADVDDDEHTEFLVGTGSYLSYAADAAPHFNDGVIYCWNNAGTAEWRYPSSGWLPAIMSGVALGRVNGPTQPPCAVFTDASGTVRVLHGKTDRAYSDQERLLWSFEIEENPQHMYFHGAVVQPLIIDVNGDGYQDVIVGTTAGYIYLLDGRPGAAQRRIWKGSTFPAGESVWRPDGNTRSDNFVYEQQNEEVRGLAIGPLNPETPDRAILLVTCSRAGLTVEVQQVAGHMLLFDLSYALDPVTLPRTWHGDDSADWPQYQGGPRRTGFAPEP